MLKCVELGNGNGDGDGDGFMSKCDSGSGTRDYNWASL